MRLLYICRYLTCYLLHFVYYLSHIFHINTHSSMNLLLDIRNDITNHHSPHIAQPPTDGVKNRQKITRNS